MNQQVVKRDEQGSRFYGLKSIILFCQIGLFWFPCHLFKNLEILFCIQIRIKIQKYFIFIFWQYLFIKLKIKISWLEVEIPIELVQ